MQECRPLSALVHLLSTCRRRDHRDGYHLVAEVGLVAKIVEPTVVMRRCRWVDIPAGTAVGPFRITPSPCISPVLVSVSVFLDIGKLFIPEMILVLERDSILIAVVLRPLDERILALPHSVKFFYTFFERVVQIVEAIVVAFHLPFRLYYIRVGILMERVETTTLINAEYKIQALARL